jgi:hypothetical protein
MEKKKWIDSNGNFWDGISIVIDDMRIWNPSEEQLIAAGYTEWVEPTPPEPTPEELLERAKQQKLFEIDEYDRSEAVNSFTLGNQTMWLTVEERQQIATQISANEAAGRESMTRWFGGQAYTFPLASWKQMLVAVEVYAGDALNVTEGHKAAINAMNSIEDIE